MKMFVPLILYWKIIYMIIQLFRLMYQGNKALHFAGTMN